MLSSQRRSAIKATGGAALRDPIARLVARALQALHPGHHEPRGAAAAAGPVRDRARPLPRPRRRSGLRGTPPCPDGVRGRVCTPVRTSALCPTGGGGGGHSEAGYGRPVDRGVCTAKTVKRPPPQPAQPPIRQLLGAANAQTAHPPTSSTAPAHQLLGSANAETTPARAPAAAADRTQRPDATCEGKTG